uniref:Uncharacterized protein n=1 Tax=Ralstonia syzygii R24 TaxID=907261 RepID=G3A7V7_9RALS|nr:hypothetical protein RALSY_40822 [Ralstonia syzygii R24]
MINATNAMISVALMKIYISLIIDGRSSVISYSLSRRFDSYFACWQHGDRSRWGADRTASIRCASLKQLVERQ